MDSPADVHLPCTPSRAPTDTKKSGTTRIKPPHQASNASLKHPPTLSDQSLTSFPSLSPSPDGSLIGRRSASSKATMAATGDSSKKDWPEPLRLRRERTSTESQIEELLNSPLLDKTRPSLFDDSPRETKQLPGNLHHATDEHIQRLIGRMGAVTLIKQLSADLAQRDADATLTRRRAEETERALKGMLRELQVSNMDIDKRLSQIKVPAGPPQIDMDDITTSPSQPDESDSGGIFDLPKTQGQQPKQQEPKARRPSGPSFMQLLAGTNATKNNSDRQSRLKEGNLTTLKEAESTTESASIAGSGTTRGKRAQTFSSSNDTNGKTAKMKSGRHSLGPTGTIKGVLRPMSPQETVPQSLQDIGPVEMNTILPEGSRPPTLVHLSSNSDLPTDRFGFIHKPKSNNGPTVVRSSQASMNDTASTASTDSTLR